jgi:hypothetical protein
MTDAGNEAVAKIMASGIVEAAREVRAGMEALACGLALRSKSEMLLATHAADMIDRILRRGAYAPRAR